MSWGIEFDGLHCHCPGGEEIKSKSDPNNLSQICKEICKAIPRESENICAGI